MHDVEAWPGVRVVDEILRARVPKQTPDQGEVGRRAGDGGQRCILIYRAGLSWLDPRESLHRASVRSNNSYSVHTEHRRFVHGVTGTPVARPANRGRPPSEPLE